MAIFEAEETHEEDVPDMCEPTFRNTTHIKELDDYLRSVGHPEVEQHMQTAQALGSYTLNETVCTD